MIYLDNAATTYPKPEVAITAIERFMREHGANPGRGGHQLAVNAGRIIFGAREGLARLFNIPDSADIVFTLNTTDALNLAIKGWVRPGDHVVTTMLEHNSVIRPLAWLEARHGVKVTKISCDTTGRIDMDELAAAVTPATRLLAVNHGSNVLGVILPLERIAAVAQKNKVPLLVDAAQTAGAIPIDLAALPVDMLAFAGHKGLFGPQGTGGLFISPELDLEEQRQGGTGSESGGPQPLVRPDRYESGTPNTPGIAGLGAGVEFILDTGIETIRRREKELIDRLIRGLSGIRGVAVYGPSPGEERLPLAAINLEGYTPHLLAHKLDKDYDIASRAGMHCAPDAHKTIGTFEQGALRLSPGFFNTDDEIDRTVAAIRQIADSRRADGRSTDCR